MNGADEWHQNIKGAFTLAAAGSLKSALSQPGDWLADRISGHQTYDSEYSMDCDDDTDEYRFAACKMLDYMDPINYTQQNPVLLTCGAQDEPFPAITVQETYDKFVNEDEIEAWRILEADVDHDYFWKIWKIPAIYESYGNVEPIFYGDLDRTYGINTILRGIKEFVHRRAQEYPESYYDAPSDPVITYTHPSSTDHVFTVESCAANDQNLLEIVFNVTVDHFWHVLPACYRGWSWDSATDTLTIDGDVYDYNNTDRQADRCNTLLTWPDEVLVHPVNNMDNPPNCAQVTILFTNGNPKPDYFAAWAEARYSGNEPGEKFSVTSDIVTYNEDPISSYIRPRNPNDTLQLLDALSPTVGRYFSLTTAANEYTGFVVVDNSDELVPFASVELFDGETGEEFDPPLVGLSDDWGWVKIENVPDEVFISKTSAEGYPPYVQYDVTRGYDMSRHLVPYSVVDEVYDAMNIERVEGSTVLMARIEYYGENAEDAESLGCGAVSFYPSSGQIIYMGWDDENGDYLDPDRDPGGDGVQNGEGTSPAYDEEKDNAISGFFVFNMDGEATTLTFTIGNEVYVTDVPYICEDCVIDARFTLAYPEYETNPTPTWCTQ